VQARASAYPASSTLPPAREAQMTRATCAFATVFYFRFSKNIFGFTKTRPAHVP
jgi:hypothetical protein